MVLSAWYVSPICKLPTSSVEWLTTGCNLVGEREAKQQYLEPMLQRTSTLKHRI